jgi:hypothetical protein
MLAPLEYSPAARLFLTAIALVLGLVETTLKRLPDFATSLGRNE